MTEPADIDFSSLEKALASLKQALVRAPQNDLERDGAIQRFEYTFELCWKFIRRVLLALGRQELGASPKPLLRDAHQEHLIADIGAWFDFLQARNDVAHVYNAARAEAVFQAAKKFPPYAQSLLDALKRLAQ